MTPWPPSMSRVRSISSTKIRIAGIHQRDTMLQTQPRGIGLGQRFALNPETGLGRLEREKAAVTPDRVVAEIGNDGAGDRREHRKTEETCHASPDSHAMNESRTDSAGQAESR